MKAKPTERKCKDCELIIPYIPRKIRCIDYYKKYTNGPVKFINDELIYYVILEWHILLDYQKKGKK